jgi:threonine/homoserine/homoserine lactone efflux protein
MPAPTTILVFALAAGVLVAIPGPNHLYIVTRSVAQGRRIGLASAFGVETGTLVHITAAAVGLSALIASSATAFNVVRYLGAAYLAYLGVRALLRDRGTELLDAQARGHSVRRAYLDGILVNVLNPKVALFFVAFLPQFVDPGRGATATQILALGLVVFVIATASDIVYALAAGALGGWLRGRPGFLRRQRYLTGSIYLGLAAAATFAGGERRSAR